jgi:tetratricopeptide (TPR) repeat protein
MTKLHRKDLKQDEIRLKMTEAVRGISLHGREVLYIITAVIAVAFIAFAWFYYDRTQQEQSANLISIALEKFNTPAGAPPTEPGAEKPRYTYKTDTEKYRAAFKDFDDIARKYSNTPAGKIARYHAGICAYYLNDMKKAEEYLSKSARVSEKNPLYYQSRIALADVYIASGRSSQAIDSLKEAAEKKDPTVPAEYILLKLADAYTKANRTKEAKDTYQKIVSSYKDSPISYQAQMRLTGPNK